MHLIAEAESTPSGVPPTPQSRSMPVFGITAKSEAATSPSEMKRMLAPTSRSVGDRLLVARAVEHDHRDVAGLAALALGDLADHVLEGLVEADQVGGSRAGRDLLHVDAGAGVEHRPPLGEGDHRERRGHAPRGQRRPLERVDGDVDDRAGCRRRSPRRCRASAPRPSRPRRSRRRRPSAPCRASAASRRRRRRRRSPSRRGPTQRPAASAPASVTRTSSSARLRSGCEGSRTSCEITCSSASATIRG